MSGKPFADVVVGIPMVGGGKRWQKVGVMMKMDNNDESKGPGFLILMDKTFNPAGVPGPETSVAISTYWPKDSPKAPTRPVEKRGGTGAYDNMDDDIPF